jgi:thiamine pyrophosphate-dependent acetolactate synthase large subunit-like protein
MKMTTEEAFVKVLQMHGIEHAFGIIGSAMMPVSDLFPKAGITFWDCAHETNAGLIADGYARDTGKISMAVAQSGPDVTGFVTAVKTAYWNHTPMLLVTPQAANRTMGQGGFQEVPHMAMFEDMVCYQEEVRDPSRVPEVLNRVIEKAGRSCAPAQVNVPRDFWTHVIDVDLPQIVRLERPSGGAEAIAAAAKLLSEAKFPVISNGAGVVIGGAIQKSVALAERLDAPVCCGYQHNDAGAFGISMNEMTSIGREEWPAITMVVFRNYQWGAEKRDTTLWYNNNFVGTELNRDFSYANVAKACGFKGVIASTTQEVTEAIKAACEDQAKGVTTIIEVVLNQELGEPFRRDAMKKPVVVAGIDRADMRPQRAA